MVAEWPVLTIAQIAASTPSAITMGPFGSDIKTDNFVPAGVPVIRGVNLSSGRFHDAEFVYITERKADELRAANAFPGDVVFTHRGTLGQVGFIPTNARFKRYVISQSQMKLTCDRSKIEPEFLFYFFRSGVGQHAFLANTSTTGVPAISRPLTSLKAIRIPVPSLSEQRAIAAILGALDDKIDLNRRMNETLEAIARALFTSWFVNFDPVRTKMEGRQPVGMDVGTTTLFPETLVDSPLGEIPQGWSVCRLADISINPRRGVNPGDVAPGTPYIGLEHMPRKSIALADWGFADEVESNKFRFLEGEILFGKLRPYFHKVGVAVQDGLCSTDILVIAPRMEDWFSVVLMHISSEPFIERMAANSTGTRMPRANWSDVASYQIALPPTPVLARLLDAVVQPMVNRIRTNILESHTLVALRDALLPKLLSGEIRVKDAEQSVGRAV